jgi:serine/threonine protein kinase
MNNRIFLVRGCPLIDEWRALLAAALPASRALEMEEHLDGCTACAAALASLAPPLEKTGQYRAVRQLGRGGMIVVYLARQVRVGRDVAVPANILLTAEGAPKITDYGPATTLDQSGRELRRGVAGTAE